mmetsp:Transcript_17087/g.47355  ORF Transcript_17087/g.47355 Transcript_17087/m.47355 type:complete len:220 (-) Transcript_17087:1246-1905(-)
MYCRTAVSGNDSRGLSSRAASIWPCEPNPQIATGCSIRFLSIASSSCTSNAARPSPDAMAALFSGNHLSKASPATLPSSASPGVRAIDSTTTMMSTWFSSSGKTFNWFAKDNSTNANSPPWLNRNPVRIDSDLVSPNRPPKEAMTEVLTASRPTSNIPMTCQFSTRISRLTEPPVVTKKSPSSKPRKGLMSASTCVLKLLSLSSTPAAKAPSVSEKPSR